MKIPSEAELIEIENRAAAIDTGIRAISDRIKYLDDHDSRHGAPAYLYYDREKLERLGEDIKLLIALARDPSQLLRDIPDDDDLDRALREYTLSDAEEKQLQELNSMSLDEALERVAEPPRKAGPKPVLIVQPKPKGKKR